MARNDAAQPRRSKLKEVLRAYLALYALFAAVAAAIALLG